MTIQGKLHVKSEIKQVSDKFRKREFVIEYVENPMYPQFISFQLIQDKCELLDAYQPGTMLSIDFNLKGREWTSPQGEVKYFNSLDAWRIAPAQVEQSATPGNVPPPTPPPDALDVTTMDDTDDLPF